MSGLGEEVRERTDALDALGNTTAATGKGFAIGSAALTALALLASYIEEIKIAMMRAVEDGKQYVDAAGNIFDPTNATTIDFIEFFQANLINPKVLVGAFLGAMAAFLFCGLTMGAVGRAAESMVQEVRRQFREIKGILEGKATPDYGRCVEISTRSAQREMIIPSLLAITYGTLYVLHRVVSEHIYVHIRRFKHFQSLPYRLNAHCGVTLAEWNRDSAVWIERA